MRAGKFVIIPIVLLSSLALQQAAPSSSRQARWENELRDADVDFCKQTAARRLEGWMDFFADDASILQNGKTVTGKVALRKYYEPLFANNEFNLIWAPTHAEAAKDGSLGYTYGAYEAKTGTDVSRGMYLTLWRRVNGKWKVAMDTGSALRQQPQ